MRKVQLILLKESLPVRLSAPFFRPLVLWKVYDEILKEFYLPVIVEYLNKPSLLASLFPEILKPSKMTKWEKFKCRLKNPF